MLKIRLIPTLLLKKGRMVKTIKFNQERDVGDPVSAAKIYNAQSVDELVLLDITAGSEKRPVLFDVISKITKECFMPLAVGGGVRTLEDIRTLLLAGADKIIINTVAVENPSFIREAANKFGSQCIVVSIDVKRTGDGAFNVLTEGGKKLTNLTPEVWAKQVEQLGGGELLLNSIDRDGTMSGYEIGIIKAVSASVTVPVIASGGAGNLQDMISVVEEGGASAIAAASIFHFTDQSPIKARFYMKNAGLNVRNV